MNADRGLFLDNYSKGKNNMEELGTCYWEDTNHLMPQIQWHWCEKSRERVLKQNADSVVSWVSGAEVLTGNEQQVLMRLGWLGGASVLNLEVVIVSQLHLYTLNH